MLDFICNESHTRSYPIARYPDIQRGWQRTSPNRHEQKTRGLLRETRALGQFETVLNGAGLNVGRCERIRTFDPLHPMKFTTPRHGRQRKLFPLKINDLQ